MATARPRNIVLPDILAGDKAAPQRTLNIDDNAKRLSMFPFSVTNKAKPQANCTLPSVCSIQ